jgi:hypothetical protein
LVMQKPTLEISETLNKIATTFLDLEMQDVCLAAIILQNRHALDLIKVLLGWTLCHVRKRMLLLC